MAWPIQPSHRPGGAPPDTSGYGVASGETFAKGAPVTLDGSGDLEELDTDDVTGIIGVTSMGAATAGTPDWDDEVPVFLADDVQVWSMQASTDGTTVATDLSGLIPGERRGVVKISGVWYYDDNDASNVIFELISMDDDNNIVFCKFIQSATATG